MRVVIVMEARKEGEWIGKMRMRQKKKKSCQEGTERKREPSKVWMVPALFLFLGGERNGGPLSKGETFEAKKAVQSRALFAVQPFDRPNHRCISVIPFWRQVSRRDALYIITHCYY